MSDYRPWEVGKPAEDRREVPTAPSEDEKPPKKAAQVDKEQFEQPPGLAEVERPTRRGRDPAGAMLLWIGGFLCISAVLFILAMGFMIGIEDLDGIDSDADDARLFRAAIGWPAFIVGALFVAAGMGILYKQPWARGLGYPLAILSLLTIVFAVPGGVALAFLGRDP